MKKLVALGMSGGVDSSMALEYLKKDWETIVGANHVVWHGVECSCAQVISRARELCEKSGIPFYCLDVSEEFRSMVADGFVKDYIGGLTPNPCVVCNQRIKFTFFYDRLRERLIADGVMQEGDQLFYSTGHYVRLVHRDGAIFLAKAADRSKDQSYMLYRLPRELLDRCIFPLGEKLKSEVKRDAQSAGLDYSSVKESQDICFIEGSYGDFIARYSGHEFKEGWICDLQGNRLGKHRGYIHYTVGQRKGLGLGSGPWYVSKVVPEKNLVIVGREDEIGQGDFTVRDLNWFIDYSGREMQTSVKVRYNSAEHPCTINAEGDGIVRVRLARKTVITRGQSAVFYDGDIVLGGGIIA